MLFQEVLDLNRVDILSAGDDDIFLAVYQENESVRIQHCHVAGIQPAILQDFGSRFRIIEVLSHDTGTFDTEFADLPLLDFIAVLVSDHALPAIARNADGTDLVDIFQAKVYAAGACGF